MEKVDSRTSARSSTLNQERRDGSLHLLYGVFSRGQQSPIFRIGWLGEGNWSKVLTLQSQTVLQLHVA